MVTQPQPLVRGHFLRIRLADGDCRLGPTTRTDDSGRRLRLTTETDDCDSRLSTADCRLPYSAPVPVHLVQHPLVHDALATLRDASTTPEPFRRMAVRISLLAGGRGHARRPEPRRPRPYAARPRRWTPRDRGVVVVPVLRAGLGMLDAVLELIPTARVGHIGLQRDEMTAVASQYYSKLPPVMTAASS